MKNYGLDSPDEICPAKCQCRPLFKREKRNGFSISVQVSKHAGNTCPAPGTPGPRHLCTLVPHQHPAQEVPGRGADVLQERIL